MKKLLLISVLVLFALNGFAARSPENSCYREFSGGTLSSHTLCRGVKSDADIKTVTKCFQDSLNITTNDRAALICSGVKSDLEARIVMKCFEDSKGNGDIAAILCSGVKTPSEMKSIQKCFMDFDGDEEGSAILCSKNGIGAHLFLVTRIRSEKKE